jgi:hypothetical protein
MTAMAAPVPSPQSLLARIVALEARLQDIETPYATTMYQLRRESVRSRIERGRILDHLGIEHVTDDEIDAALPAPRSSLPHSAGGQPLLPASRR